MKKILIVDIGKEKGGIERYIYNIYEKIDKKKIHIDFLNYNDCCAYEDDFKKGNSMIYHITSRKKNIFRFYKDLKTFFRNHEYDTVWIQTCSASNIVAHIMTKKYSNARLLTHAHVTHAEKKNLLHDIVATLLHKINQKRLNRITDVFLACSLEAGKYLYGENESVIVLPNGIDLKNYVYRTKNKIYYRNEFEFSKDDVILGHVGRFSKVKNHRFIIDFFDFMHKIEPNLKLLLVGDGEEKETIKKLVGEKGLNNNVVFAGERSDVSKIYSVMDIFIFPSFNEGFGIAVIEAQAALVPCIINEKLSTKLDVSNICFRQSLSDGFVKWKNTFDKAISAQNKQYFDNIYDYDINNTIKKIESILLGG